MKDEDIDFSDIPKTTPEMWEKGFIRKGIVRKGLNPIKNKQQITLRIDQDVLDFFKEQGKGYQTKINQLLRTYMEEVQKQS